MLRLCESPSTHLTSKSKKVLSGLFAEFDKKNQNERIYPRKVYEPALEELIPKINEGRLLGECDHPADRDEVCLSNVSHVIRECRVDGNKVYGTIELLDTPSGKIAQALVEAGIPIGISSRGIGNVRRVNEGDEVTDFKLITFDIVADPSFSNAILSESAKFKLKTDLDSVAGSLPLNESIGGNDVIRSKIDTIKESIDKVPTVTDSLVESIGALTEDKMSLETRLSESMSRNRFLQTNMNKLQESFNILSESAVALETKYSELEKSRTSEIKSLKESYDEKINSIISEKDTSISEMNQQIIKLRKELAIEKRGLSYESMMPILEGLETMSDIENKLDSVKHLGARRYVVPETVSSLTEGNRIAKPQSKLSRIVSSV